MYILAWADNMDWVQLFIVWAYNTLEEADDEMLKDSDDDITNQSCCWVSIRDWLCIECWEHC